MSLSKAKAYLEKFNADKDIIVLDESSATVALAAKALGVEEARIAKTMSFLLGTGAILVVTAGDVLVDNKKFKAEFHEKAKMIPPAEVEGYIGHAPGGVCPFGVNENVKIYLDVSLKRFDTVYPAAGDSNTAIKLTNEKLLEYSGAQAWVDVCKMKSQTASV